MKIEWDGPRGKYFISGTNGYTISKAQRGKKTLYVAWPPKPPRDQTHNCIGVFSNLEDAKRKCTQHRKERNND